MKQHSPRLILLLALTLCGAASYAQQAIAQPDYGGSTIRFYNKSSPVAASPCYTLNLTSDINANWGTSMGINDVVISGSKMFVSIDAGNGNGGVMVYNYSTVYPTKTGGPVSVIKPSSATNTHGQPVAGIAIQPGTGNLFVGTVSTGIFTYTASSGYLQSSESNLANQNDEGIAYFMGNFAFDAAGNLWFTTFYGDVSAGDNFLACFKTSGGGVINKNEYYVITNTNPSTVTYTAHPLTGTTTGPVYLLSAPEGVAVDASGNVWVGNNNDAGVPDNCNSDGTLVKISASWIATMLAGSPGFYNVPSGSATVDLIPSSKLGGLFFDGNTLYINDQGTNQGSSYTSNGTVWKYNVNTTFNTTNCVASGIHTTYPGNGLMAEDNASGFSVASDCYATSSAKNITSFTFPGETGNAVINATNHTVTASYITHFMPYQFSFQGGIFGYHFIPVSATPTIGVSTGATISPLSGVSQNFTSSVPYTVTAQNGSTQVWTVTVTRNYVPIQILRFYPLTDQISHLVTISGTGFSETPSHNAVYFGATKANITAGTDSTLTVTVPPGATFENVTTTNLDVNLSAKSYLAFGPKEPGYIDFGLHQDFAAGSQPTCVKVGDIDGDGKPDLVIANQGSNSISVLINTSTSGAVSFAPEVTFATGMGPYSFNIADIDGDGRLDIAVANQFDTTVSVLINNTISAGSPSFLPQAVFATGHGPRSVSIGDIDGDGRPDLAVANNYDNTVSVLLNRDTAQGYASFAPQVTFAAGSNPLSVSIGDIDGDGKPDLAFATLGNMVVLHNTSVPDTARFVTQYNYFTGTNSDDVSIYDIDGDGKPDVTIANVCCSSISVFRSTSSSGSISFANPVTFASGSNVNWLSIGDIDGDGKPEVAVVNDTTVSVYHNTSVSGTISFGAPVSFLTGNFPYSLQMADIDGDGRLDLSVADYGSGSVSVLKQINPAPVITSFSPAAARVGTDVVITGTGFNTTLASNVVYFGATRATVVAASATSVTVTVPACGTYQYISLTNLANNLTGYSPKPFDVTLSGGGTDFSNPYMLPSGYVQLGDVAVRDLDGDGKPDFAVAYNDFYTHVTGVEVFTNTSTSGTVSTSSGTLFASGAAPNSVRTADVDGDGRPDLIIDVAGGFGVLLNTSSPGSLSFAPMVTLSVGSELSLAAVGDLDMDGRADLVLVSGNPIDSEYIYVLRNTSGPGSVSFASALAFAVSSVAVTAGSVVIGDMDGDGIPDLAVGVMNRTTRSISVLRNITGYGYMNFAAPVSMQLPYTVFGAFNLSIGDIDGDGHLDLAVSDYGFDSMRVFRNTSSIGSLSFAGSVSFGGQANPTNINIGDVNGDGKPDIAVTNNYAGSITVFANISTPGNIGFTASQDTGLGWAAKVAIGDIDGDGKPDMTLLTGDDDGHNWVTVLQQVTCPLTATAAATSTSSCGRDTFTVLVGNGSPGVSCVWFRNNIQEVSGTIYTPTSLNYGDSVWVRVTGIPACGTSSQTQISNKIKITTTGSNTPTVSIAANNTNLNLGGTITLTATPVNAGTNPVYAWYHNGAVIGSVTQSVMTYNGALGNGDQIYCTLTTTSCNAVQTAVSNTVTFTRSGSSEKNITTLTMPDQIGTSVIDTVHATVSAVVSLLPAQRTAIHPTRLYISTGATYGPSYANNRDFSIPVTYTVTAQDGSTRVWTVTVVDGSGQRLDGTSSSADEPVIVGLTLYPNPASTYITALMQGGADPTVVTILDLAGRVVYNQQLPPSTTINHQIDVSEYATGDYIVHISVGDRSETKKFAVLRQ